MFPGNCRSRRNAYAIGVAVLCMARHGWADTLWQGTSGDWFDPTNWSVEIPTATDNADINNGGTAQISAGEDAVALSLTLGGTADQTGSLSLTGGTLTCPTINVDSGGSYSMINSATNTGIGGALSCTTFNLNGGTAAFVSISLDSGAIVPVVSMPPGVTSPVFDISSGTLAVEGSIILGASAQVSSFTQPSDLIFQPAGLSVGKAVGSISTYTLPAGTLTASIAEFIGNKGQGTFNQTGGTNSVGGVLAGLYVGYQANSIGTYLLCGGSLLANFSALLDYNDGGPSGLPIGECVGCLGTGTFIQTGGTNSLAPANLYVGCGAGSQGTYKLSGGNVTGTDAVESIGTSGTGTFIQTGGTNSPMYEYVGYSSTGTYTQAGGTNAMGALTVGGAVGNTGFVADTGTGTYNLCAGTLTAQAETLAISGTATFIQSGGTNTCNALWLSINQAYNNGSSYLLSGGSLIANKEEIGDPLNPLDAAIITQTGGTNTVGQLIVDDEGLGGNAIVESSDSINGNNTGSSYVLTGGALNVTNSLAVDYAGTLTIANVTATAPTATNQGIINLTASGGSNSYGGLSISGNYSQSSGSDLTIGIGGDPLTDEIGLLTVGGTATLGGMLDVAFLNGFTPTYGETFDFLSAGSISGQFSGVDSPYTLQLNYTPSGVSLTVVPEPTGIALLAIGMGLLMRRRSRG